MIKKNKILIATGGTGGHIFPAYSLANYFIKNNYNVKITIDSRGLKYLKNHENLDLIKIPSSPLIKKNILKFIFSLFVVFSSILRSLIFLLFNRPSVVFGMGGYSSFPVCIASAILRIKFVIYENNLIIGKANKYLLPFAKKIFVSYKDLEEIPVRYNNKILEIGNIIREEIINSKVKENASNRFDDIRILILGGSQAAKVFAEKLPNVIEKFKNTDMAIKVYQQCQSMQNNKLAEFYKEKKIDYEIFNFTDKIIDYYSKVNLVITRSGASVLGELINVKIPFISIPLPTSADNHQFKNAVYYRKRGFGYLIAEKDINDQLYDLIKSIFKDKSLIKNMLTNQSQYSDKNIFKNINTHIEKIINEKN
ncbi:UDP-N-acetylglucosamine--N-acetylmuramyl-(pentapeptide) pyrophosphoryl-undecaprenol N-acetylglucosamine transferase [Pelagibacteraceae bacterium]|jgi:UDP-N-acetylglucosamine--N-acetylmuramyl-(pentapeptide) pyrophosphoryl-undecaprenol N-acetylglucosamine transferase|nr:UDP-N-acetylglucosamine--N-acetylmuramyl-(pentapeptide) pyrophosphoryl-undecaprenol N-acetylglucosamine transferase [Pelagibacteraceae bacterium]